VTRRIVRGSRFKVGQRVVVDGDSSGDYIGHVVETHFRLKKPAIFGLQPNISPGVTVLVDYWDGSLYRGQNPGFESFEIIAYDKEVSLYDEDKFIEGNCF